MIDETYVAKPGRLSDRDIAYLCVRDNPMISPFLGSQAGKPSFGLSSSGYDLRLSDEYMVQDNYGDDAGTIIDPLDSRTNHWVKKNAVNGEIILGPGECILASTVEYINIPDDVQATVLGKSSLARNNVLVNATPLECFDDKTEILTEEGWAHFEDVIPGTIVATINRDSILEYQPVLAKQKHNYSGEMISIQGRSVDLLVTPEHSLYVKKRRNLSFECIEAEKVEGFSNLEMKRDAFWIGEDPEFFVLSGQIDGKKAGVRDLSNKIYDILKQDANMTAQNILDEIEEDKPKIRSLCRTLGVLYDLGSLSRKMSHRTDGRDIGASHYWEYSLINPVEYGLLDELSIPTEDWCRFFGLWIAEGSSYKTNDGDYVVKVACCSKRNKPLERSILSKIPVVWNESPIGFSTCSKQLSNYLMRFGHSNEKYIPSEIRSLSRKHLTALVSGYILGDGNVETKTGSSASIVLAGNFQEIGMKIGHPVSCWVGAKAGDPVNIDPRYTCNYDVIKFRFSDNATPRIGRKENAWSREEYSGYVYDVTVPNHTIYVRRNGKAVWSGNCGWNGTVTLEITNCDPTNSVKLYVGQGVSQCIFDRMANPPSRTYSNRESGGAYQGQKGPTPSRGRK